MAWDNPQNFEFPLSILCAERLRIKKIFDNTFVHGTTYSYKGEQNFWQQLWSNRYAPNSTLNTWNPDRRTGQSTPPYYPGPDFRIATVVQNFVNRPNYAEWLPLSILEELQKKWKWEDLPEWEYVESVVATQTLQSEPTPYQPYTGTGYYREEFIEFILRRAKKLHEFNYFLPHIGRCFLGSGRVAPSVEENRPELEYKNLVYFVTNTEETKVTLYNVKCDGCCCCCC